MEQENAELVDPKLKEEAERERKDLQKQIKVKTAECRSSASSKCAEELNLLLKKNTDLMSGRRKIRWDLVWRIFVQAPRGRRDFWADKQGKINENEADQMTAVVFRPALRTIMQEKIQMIRVAILLFVFAHAFVFCVYGQPKNTQNVKREIEIKVFFINPKLPEFEHSCEAGAFVKRKIPATKQVADAALELLFAGPNLEEKALGMLYPGRLGEYYIGVTISRGMAIVNFRPGAEEHLHVNGPLCMQEETLAPIEKTLRQFQAIKLVAYAINGKLIEDWDA